MVRESAQPHTPNGETPKPKTKDMAACLAELHIIAQNSYTESSCSNSSLKHLILPSENPVSPILITNAAPVAPSLASICRMTAVSCLEFTQDKMRTIVQNLILCGGEDADEDLYNALCELASKTNPERPRNGVQIEALNLLFELRPFRPFRLMEIICSLLNEDTVHCVRKRAYECLKVLVKIVHSEWMHYQIRIKGKKQHNDPNTMQERKGMCSDDIRKLLEMLSAVPETRFPATNAAVNDALAGFGGLIQANF